MAVNRFAGAAVLGRCHADAPDCGCECPTMEATLWMAYAQRDPDGMASWLNKAAVAIGVRTIIGQVVTVDRHDVARMVADGHMERWLRILDEAINPTN